MSVCPVGYYLYQNATCAVCTNAPPHSFYVESGVTTSSCPYECDPGYATFDCETPIGLNNGLNLLSYTAWKFFAINMGIFLTIPFFVLSWRFIPGWASLVERACGKSCGAITESLTTEQYQAFLLRRRVYAGCPNNLLKYGVPWLMKPGAFEDFLRYALCEHHLLGIGFVDSCHSFTAVERAVQLYSVNSVTFYLTTFAYNTLAFSGGIGVLFDAAVISFKMYLYWLMYAILAYPSDTGGRFKSCGVTKQRFRATFIVVATFLYYFTAVWMASSSAFDSDKSRFKYIASYLATVFLGGAVEEIMIHFYLFVNITGGKADSPGCCHSMWSSFCRRFRVGAWTREKVCCEYDSVNMNPEAESSVAATWRNWDHESAGENENSEKQQQQQQVSVDNPVIELTRDEGSSSPTKAP